MQPLIYYKNRYGNIPPWILVKDLTFGELVRLYKLSLNDIKTKVIKNIVKNDIDETTKEFFYKSMELFNNFRNWAAHGGRIYNHRPKIELPYNETYHKILNITKDDHNLGIGRNDFAALIISVMFFFQNNPKGTFEFIVYLNETLNKYKAENPNQYNNVIKEQGIPDNYHDLILDSLGLTIR